MIIQNKKYLLELVAPVGVSGLPGTTCFPILASCAGIGRSRLGNALKPFAGADALKGETAECIVHFPAVSFLITVLSFVVSGQAIDSLIVGSAPAFA